MIRNGKLGWEFIDDEGTFSLANPHRYSALYFPLCNTAGIFSSVTPTLHGDLKADHNSFLTPPVSIEDLHNSRAARNFWVYVEGYTPWSASGSSAEQVSTHFTSDDEESVLEAGFLWHRMKRNNSKIGLQAEITSFVPASEDRVELMKVTITNSSNTPKEFSSTAAVPMFGRSADNLRDHRHVTSLLLRTRCNDFGVLVTPTLSFDERGHLPNHLTYIVLGVDGDGAPPLGFSPIVEDFIGEGGSLDWPETIIKHLAPCYQSGMSAEGYEALGGIHFPSVTLMPHGKKSYIIFLAIIDQTDEADQLIRKYGSEAQFDAWLNKTKQYWRARLAVPQLSVGNRRFEGWLRWVTLQPLLRRYFGNSFLPYHDYGHGGRGWRDLWQDILALMMIGGEDVSEILFDNYGGVRIDGSNATIIGSNPGEFKADRNNIPRVWMDHAAWPLITTSEYIDETGDLAFLLRQQVYFKDHLIARAQEIDNTWSPEQGTILRTTAGEPYLGTILEHLLVQNLTQFFNVGEHNIIRLEGADWNDAMDMAAQRGESIAFTAFYAGNLHRLSGLARELISTGVAEIEIAAEILPLLDTISGPVDYGSVLEKRSRLSDYFSACGMTVAGRKITIPLRDVAADLEKKAAWMRDHIRNQEWLTDSEGFGWFNGYYDNDGARVEGVFPKGIRMILTGQVFALMGGVASPDQANAIIRSVDRYLYDTRIGGYRLNTNFEDVLLNLGRGFGFAYGHKENGSMFSHMAVMYAYALYQRGKVKQGYKVLKDIYEYCQDFSRCHIYPGIPEYINERGRGVYTYLTGSASWYLLTLVKKAFGVHGRLGDLVIEPKLVAGQFDPNGDAYLITDFADRKMKIIYHNPAHLDYGGYLLQEVRLDGRNIETLGESVIIPRGQILELDNIQIHEIEIALR